MRLDTHSFEQAIRWVPNRTLMYGAIEPNRVAEVHAFRGEADAAFEWLRTVDRLPRLRRPSLIRFSPLLKSLHEDARSQAWAAADSPLPK